MTEIVRHINVPACYLNGNIQEHILELLSKTTKNECTKQYGYILSINEIIGILDNTITSANSDIIVTVKFIAETLKPTEGKIFDGEVCMVFANGIFVNIKDKLKVLIPVTNIPKYTFNKSEMQFEYKKKKIKKGDDIKVKITGVKYSKHSFSCFGEMVT